MLNQNVPAFVFMVLVINYNETQIFFIKVDDLKTCRYSYLRIMKTFEDVEQDQGKANVWNPYPAGMSVDLKQIIFGPVSNFYE